MGRIGVTSRDLRRVRDLLDPARTAGPDDQIAPSFLADVAAVVGCDHVTFVAMDAARRTSRLQELLAEDQAAGDTEGPELEELFWTGFWECLACSYPQRTGDHVTVTRRSDFSCEETFRRTRMGAYMTACGVQHEALVPLPMLDTDDRRLLLGRSGSRDFSERDVTLLALLRPHVIEMHLRQLRRRRGVPDLTPRQWDVLRLIATGCSNRQVARALAISEATVGKHLESIYLRLGVNSRTEAVATVPAPELYLHGFLGPGRRVPPGVTPAARPAPARQVSAERAGRPGRRPAGREITPGTPRPFSEQPFVSTTG